MRVIAIDPGASGGIAWSESVNGAKCSKMPETRRETIDLLKSLVVDPVDTVAYIEKIAGFIPDAGASMMFEFGKNVERCGCILETLGVRLIEIRPQEWQQGLHLGKIERQKAPKLSSAEVRKAVKAANARAKTEWKNKLKAEAERRFPMCCVTLKTADALLILDYAKSEIVGWSAQPQELPI